MICDKHQIERVYVDEYDNNRANVVYWCRKCGAVQVKFLHEYNGATADNFTQIQFPKQMKE